MRKITGFAFIKGVEQSSISYTCNEIDIDGNIIKSNIRKSVAVKLDNIDLTDNINLILNFLETKENV